MSFACLPKAHSLFCAYLPLTSRCNFIFYSYTFQQGFYKGALSPHPEAWTPALKEPLVIQADYQLTASSQVVAESLVLLHFILANIRPQGNPARTASELLTAFLPDESFMYKEIVFDLATDQLVARYTAEMVEFVKTLQR
jgi:hypothetical protein